MAEIALSQGTRARVDDVDLSLLSPYKWSARFQGNIWYAQTNIVLPNGRRTMLTMHRLLAGEQDLQVDHRNGDGLDNRRENLRVATVAQNQQNRIHLKSNKTSRFRGVYWYTRDATWEAMVSLGKPRRIRLGRYKVEEDAALAYDAGARRVYGEFARPNFPKRRDERIEAEVERRLARGATKAKRVLVTVGDRTQTVAQWARELGRNPKRIYARLASGFSAESALSAERYVRNG